MKISADRVYRTWAGLPAFGAALQRAFVLVPFALLNARGYAWQVWDDSQMKPITNLCSQSNIAPKTLFSIWQMILSSKWIWPSFRNEDLHLRDKSIRLSASCHSHSWMTSCRKPNTTTPDFRKQVPELSLLCMINDCHFEMIYDSHFESRAVSIGRSQIETARRQGRRAVISRA